MVRAEFQVDATTVNTHASWRDRTIGVFARRPFGGPCSPAEWDLRTLPNPTARLAFVAVEEIDRFAPRRGAWAEGLRPRSFDR